MLPIRAVAGGVASRSGKKRGAALVITLVFLVLLTVVAVGFILNSTAENANSYSYAVGSEVKRLSDTAVQIVMGQIRLATSGSNAASVAWASQPGMIRTYGDSSGNASSQPLAYYKLYSSDSMVVTSDQISSFTFSSEVPSGNGSDAWQNQPALFTDLNAPALAVSGSLEYPIFDPDAAAVVSGTLSLVEGCSISSPASYVSSKSASATNNPAPMPVKWLYILKNGDLTAPAGVDATGNVVNWNGIASAKVPSAKNPIVGRIGFWTDDETCKLNLNTASGNNYWDAPMFDSGIEAEFSRYQPASHEYTRYPGHPSTTSLLPVLWSYGGFSSPDTILFPANFAPSLNSGYLSLANSAASEPTLSTNASSYFEKLMNLAPRNVWAENGNVAGSGGGTQPTITTSWGGTTQSNPFAISSLDNDRLYASVDEIMFLPSRSSRQTSSSSEFQFTRNDISKLRFFLTTTSKAPEVNMFNLPKVSMWPIDSDTNKRSPLDQLIAFCSTYNNHSYYVTRHNPDSTSADYTQNQRNGEIYNYLQSLMGKAIPGFGASFKSRYGTPGSNQILTECIDYIRGTVNLLDGSGPSSTPFKYAFTSAPASLVATAVPGMGQVVPLIHPENGTKGMGRFPTIKQVALMFIAQAANQPPVKVTPAMVPLYSHGYSTNPMHPWVRDRPATATISGTTFTANDSSGQPAQYPSFSGQTHAGLPYLTSALNSVGAFDSNPAYKGPALAPYETQMQAILLIDPVNVAPGFVPMGVNYNIRVTWNDNITAGGSNLYSAGISQTAPSTVSYGDADTGSPYYYAISKNSINRTAASGTNTYFLSSSVKVGASGVALFGETFAFGGGRAKVEILTSDGSVVQTINLNFPAATFPTPILPIQPPWLSGNTDPANANKDVSFPPQSTFDLTPSWMLTFDRTSSLSTQSAKSGWSRLTMNNGSPSDGAYLPMPLWPPANGSLANNKLTCDTVRSLECAYGDTRVIAALATVPESFFVPHKYYYDSTTRGAHSFRGLGTRLGQDDFVEAGTASFLTLAHQKDPSLYYYSQSDSAFLNAPTDVPQMGPSSFPQVTSMVDFNDADYANNSSWATMKKFSDVWAKGGDYDNGPNHQADGPYINKPNEGVAVGPNLYPDFDDQTYSGGGTSFFPPNRQIPSPVMFGSLPVIMDQGVSSLNSLTPANAYFWRTLLFCPNPNVSTHPSLNQTPPDYALLDFFNMPVVEPYAISEPFSTAGRVNLNYQIAPFTYIKRDTAMRGVLRSTFLTAVQDKWMGHYKSSNQFGGSVVFGDGGNNYDKMQSGSGYFSFRYPINPTQTLQQFDSKFNSGEIFRSPSEICSIWLYPGTQPTSSSPDQTSSPLVTDQVGSTANIYNWWYDQSGSSAKSLTGDNMRERPYATLYPQLTTKSNSYTVHYRVEVLKKIPSTAVDQWVENKDHVLGEYRGSTLIERYIDPGDTTLGDFATETTGTSSLNNDYKFRILSVRKFAP
jgi:uncharacterized protein (TIGR02600 family)